MTKIGRAATASAHSNASSSGASSHSSRFSAAAPAVSINKTKRPTDQSRSALSSNSRKCSANRKRSSTGANSEMVLNISLRRMLGEIAAPAPPGRFLAARSGPSSNTQAAAPAAAVITNVNRKTVV
jgi:hypothetical protein